MRYVITLSGISRCLDCIERRTQSWKIVHDVFACLKRSMAFASFYSRVHLISDFRLYEFNLSLLSFHISTHKLSTFSTKMSCPLCDELVLSFEIQDQDVDVALPANNLPKVHDAHSRVCLDQSFFVARLHRKPPVTVLMALFQRSTPHGFRKFKN